MESQETLESVSFEPEAADANSAAPTTDTLTPCSDAGEDNGATPLPPEETTMPSDEPEMGGEPTAISNGATDLAQPSHRADPALSEASEPDNKLTSNPETEPKAAS